MHMLFTWNQLCYMKDHKMKTSKISIAIASLLLVTSAAMAQTAPTKKPESGDGPNPIMKNQDTTASPNTRAEVKSDIPRTGSPKESGDGPNAAKKDMSVGNNTRADVKADTGTPKMKVESGDGPRAISNSSNASANASGRQSESRAKRAERKAAAKAKRDAKMGSMDKPAATN